MLRCVFLDDYQNVALSLIDWSPLAGKVEARVLNDHIADVDALAAALADAEIVVVMRERTPFRRELLAKLPNLKLLITMGMFNASFDMDAAREFGVTVCGTQGSFGSAAELTFGLILSLMRHIPAEDAAFKRGEARWQGTVGRDLAGRTLGIVGLGRLGSRLARYGLAFEMKVTAWSRNLTDARCAEAGVARAASLDELLRGADVVSLLLPLTPQSRGLIGARELGLLKHDAILVNTSRGPIVDEAALIETLKQRRIAGAGLDVYDIEPLPSGHPFRKLDNIVATPHLGYVTEGTYRFYFAHAVENIAAFIAGRPMRVLNGA